MRNEKKRNKENDEWSYFAFVFLFVKYQLPSPALVPLLLSLGSKVGFSFFFVFSCFTIIFSDTSILKPKTVITTTMAIRRFFLGRDVRYYLNFFFLSHETTTVLPFG